MEHNAPYGHVSDFSWSAFHGTNPNKSLPLCYLQLAATYRKLRDSNRSGRGRGNFSFYPIIDGVL